MSELLTCPFCGDCPEITDHERHMSGNGYLSIRCCAIMEEPYIMDYYRPKKNDKKSSAEKRLIKRWNHRGA